MFEPGQLVVLRSGGPKMTVAKVDGDLVICVWQRGDDTKRETFEAALLKPYEPSRAPQVARGDYF